MTDERRPDPRGRDSHRPDPRGPGRHEESTPSGQSSGRSRTRPAVQPARPLCGQPPGQSAERPIPVVWDKRLRRPTAFVWRRRRYRVERVVRTWVVETGWWDDSVHVSRRYCRVRADGRLFDIYFDRLTRNWFLEKALG